MLKRILLADDDNPIKRLILTVLAAKNDWRVCDEAGDGVEAVEKAMASQPDLAILDIQMPRMNGLEAARQIIANCKNTAVLVVSLYAPCPVVLDAVKEAGAEGFVSKTSISSELIPAIEALFDGGTYFHASELHPARHFGAG